MRLEDRAPEEKEELVTAFCCPQIGDGAEEGPSRKPSGVSIEKIKLLPFEQRSDAVGRKA
jgi:hypothetical protein